MNKLRIGAIYTDRHVGQLLYMGRLGYEFNETKGIKGSNIFRVLSHPKHMTFVWLTKKEIEQLQP
jgi:hypothetical protein